MVSAAGEAPIMNARAALAGRTRAKVCVLGASLDVDNRGVLALGVSVARLLQRTIAGVDIYYYYGARSGGRRRLAGSDELELTVRNCRMSLKSSPSQHILLILGLALLYRLGWRGPAMRNVWLRTLRDADLVGEIRGGDSFSDIYGFRRFLVGSLPLLSVVLLGRDYVMLPQTYGPFRHRASRVLARIMLRRARVLLTRDRNCEPIVRELCGRIPQFCPDVAFTLEGNQPKDLRITPDGLDLDGEGLLVGVNVSGLLYMGGYTGRNMFGLHSDYRALIDRLISAILSNTRAKVLVVPHVFGSEREEEACAELWRSHAASHPGRVFRIERSLTEREVKWVIGNTRFFVGSRMHACIAALSQFVPTVGLAYSDKFSGVFQSAGVGDAVLDLRTTDHDVVVRRTLQVFERREAVTAMLRSRIPSVQQAVLQTFADIAPTGRSTRLTFSAESAGRLGRPAP